MVLDKLKPKYLIETRYEPREKFQFDQPYSYCNNIRYDSYLEDSYERQNWGELKWKNVHYSNSIRVCRYYSSLWTNYTARDNALETIYNFITTTKNVSSITELFGFEIYLMNNGYTMKSFDPLNAINPSFTLIFKDAKLLSSDGTIAMYSVPEWLGRWYSKKDKAIAIAFGHGSVNFYFRLLHVSCNNYQVPINPDQFDMAIEGQLPIL